MRIHEIRTPLSADEVIERARSFFTHAGTPYASFEENAGEGWIRLHLEVGEIVIGTVEHAGATLVRGSASRGGHLLTRFLTTLAPPSDARQTLHRHGVHEIRGAGVAVLTAPARPPTVLSPAA
jgi:hypothetical protein